MSNGWHWVEPTQQYELWMNGKCVEFVTGILWLRLVAAGRDLFGNLVPTMKTWKRATDPYACGSCAAIISIGEPVPLLQPMGLTQPKKRCRVCAGEPVPAYLPEESAPEVPAMTKLGSVPLPYDWRQKAAGSET